MGSYEATWFVIVVHEEHHLTITGVVGEMPTTARGNVVFYESVKESTIEQVLETFYKDRVMFIAFRGGLGSYDPEGIAFDGDNKANGRVNRECAIIVKCNKDGVPLEEEISRAKEFAALKNKVHDKISPVRRKDEEGSI